MNFLHTKDIVVRFLAQVDSILSVYESRGPGHLDDSLLVGLRHSYQEVQKSVAKSDHRMTVVQAAVDTVFELCCQCVLDPQGLCFVTGEAGLIPRSDLIEKLDNSRQRLHDFVAEPKRK